MDSLLDFSESSLWDSSQNLNLKVQMITPENIHIFCRGIPDIANLYGPRNCHNQFILFICIKGVFNLIIDNIAYELHPMTAALVFPGQAHVRTPLSNHQDVQVILIRFSVKKQEYLTEFHLKVLKLGREQLYFLRMLCSVFTRIRKNPDLIGATECAGWLSLLLNSMRRSQAQQVSLPPAPGVRYIQAALRLLYKENIMFNMTEVARQVGISDGHLRSLFRRYIKKTPHQVWAEYQWRRAQNLLCHSNLDLSEIAQQCGFGSIYSFSRFFCRKQGIAPSVYRNNFHSKDNPSIQNKNLIQ